MPLDEEDKDIANTFQLLSIPGVQQIRRYFIVAKKLLGNASSLHHSELLSYMSDRIRFGILYRSSLASETKLLRQPLTPVTLSLRITEPPYNIFDKAGCPAPQMARRCTCLLICPFPIEGT